MARRRARELAFQTLFQAERGGHDLWEVWQDVYKSSLAEIAEGDDEEAVYGDPLDKEGIEFARLLLQRYDDHRAALDAHLEAVLEGWTFGQMSQTDLTILRLAMTELLHDKTMPAEVTIEIAVRIAKKFGGDESGRFVNGVLARVYNDGKNDYSKNQIKEEKKKNAD